MTKEIYIVLMLNLMTMKFDGEVVFSLKLDVFFMQRYFQSILIHVFIEKGSQFFMYKLTASVYSIALTLKLLSKVWINVYKSFELVVHICF